MSFKQVLVLGGLMFGGAGLAQAQAPQMPQGRDVTIQGTVIDVSCKFGQGLSGEAHKMCSEICSDRGLPLAILGDDGTLYIPTTAEMPGSGQNEKLKPFAEQRVRIQGKAFMAGGAQAIQISTIRKA